MCKCCVTYLLTSANKIIFKKSFSLKLYHGMGQFDFIIYRAKCRYRPQHNLWFGVYTQSFVDHSVLDLSGGWEFNPLWCLSTPKFVFTPQKKVKISQKNTLLTPSNFPTNRVLGSFANHTEHTVLVQWCVWDNNRNHGMSPRMCTRECAEHKKRWTLMENDAEEIYKIYIFHKIPSTGKIIHIRCFMFKRRLCPVV